MRSALRAEWTKLWTTPAAALLLVATVTVTVVLCAAVSALACPPAGCVLDSTKLALTGIQLGQAPVAILAVLVVSGEYGTGLVLATVVAVPRRPTVLIAKAAVLTVPVAVAGGIAVLACLLIAHPPVNGSTVRAGVGSVVYLVLIAWLSLGVAAAVRDSATAIGVILALVYLPAIVAQVLGSPQWQRFLEHAAPMSALTPWAGLGVPAAWAATALVTGGTLFHLRDV